MKKQIDLYGPGSGGGGGERTPLFGLCVRVCAAEQAMAFQGVESFKNRVCNFTVIIKRLEQGVFLDWKPFKESEDLR